MALGSDLPQDKVLKQGPYLGTSWMQAEESDTTTSEMALAQQTQFGYQFQSAIYQILFRYGWRSSSGGNSSLNLNTETRFAEFRLGKPLFKINLESSFFGALGMGLTQTRVETSLLGQTVTQSSDWLGFLRPVVGIQYDYKFVQFEVEGFLFNSEELRPNPAFGLGLGMSVFF